MQLQYSPAPVDLCCWVECLETRYLEVGGARYGSSIESSFDWFFWAVPRFSEGCASVVLLFGQVVGQCMDDR